MTFLERAQAEAEALGRFYARNEAALVAAGAAVRAASLAGESLAPAARALAAIYAAEGREAPAWTIPYLTAVAA